MNDKSELSRMKENEPESLTALFRRGLREREDAGKRTRSCFAITRLPEQE